MILKYINTVVGTNEVIDLRLSKDQNAKIQQEEHCKRYRVKINKTDKEVFLNDPTPFWKVRDLIEKLNTNSIHIILETFFEIYDNPEIHKDWLYPLKTGLCIKMNERRGGYNIGEYTFNGEIPLYIRTAGINNISIDYLRLLHNEKVKIETKIFKIRRHIREGNKEFGTLRIHAHNEQEAAYLAAEQDFRVISAACGREKAKDMYTKTLYEVQTKSEWKAINPYFEIENKRTLNAEG